MNPIEELYKLELGQPVKIAHKLTDKVLHPEPIEGEYDLSFKDAIQVLKTDKSSKEIKE